MTDKQWLIIKAFMVLIVEAVYLIMFPNNDYMPWNKQRLFFLHDLKTEYDKDEGRT